MSHGLNPSQQSAVEHEQGPMLVLAGAGSGKTRVITERIARLLRLGARPEQIMAVSFTNKAAQEMRERMSALIGDEPATRLQLSTFHSFGVRFLNEESKRLGYDGRFVIFDQADSMGLVRELMRQGQSRAGDRKLDPMAVLTRISLWKNELKAPGDIPETDFEYDAIARELYPEYEASLRSMHAVDFDDLVVAPTRLLEDNEDLREKWQGRFRHLLVDEFQDTNGAQLRLVKCLTNRLNNICVVGDDDQSIYGWRGADVNNILDFERHFAGTKVVKLEDNYRSKSEILDVANAAISRATRKRHDKTLRAARGSGDPVQRVQCDDPGHEARFVVSEIRDLHRAQTAYRDMAILYRSNQQARLIEEELRAAQVPYKLFGGTQFFDRKEVKDAAAYLRVIVNPRDHISLRRVLNYPPRGIGSTTAAKLERHRLARNISLYDALKGAGGIHDLPAAAATSVAAFVDIIERARARFRDGRQLGEAAGGLFQEVGLREALLSSDDKAAARRWQNIIYLQKAIARYEQKPGGEKPSLAQFLTRITMRFDEETAEDSVPNQVTLSTLHGAKGLEFPVVFLIGIVEGQLPHSRTTDPKISEAAPTDVDEERRLFYVGVTRARDRLYLSTFKRKMLRGKVMPVVPSRFLEGLPEDAIEPYARKEAEPLDSNEMADMAAAVLAQLAGK